MKPKITVFRALSAVLARRFIRLVSIVGLSLLGILLLIIVALSYAVSSWWLLLLIPYTALGLGFLFARLIVMWIVHRFYRAPLAASTTTQLEAFSDKIQRLLEARTMG